MQHHQILQTLRFNDNKECHLLDINKHFKSDPLWYTILSSTFECSISFDTCFPFNIIEFILNIEPQIREINYPLIIFNMDVNIGSIFNKGTNVLIKYSIYDLEKIGITDEDLKPYMEIYTDLYLRLCKRGCESRYARCIINNLFLSKMVLKFTTEQLLKIVDTLDISSLEMICKDSILADGQSPTILLNEFYESVCQKSLSIKHQSKRDTRSGSSDFDLENVTLYINDESLVANYRRTIMLKEKGHYFPINIDSNKLTRDFLFFNDCKILTFLASHELLSIYFQFENDPITMNYGVPITKSISNIMKNKKHMTLFKESYVSTIKIADYKLEDYKITSNLQIKGAGRYYYVNEALITTMDAKIYQTIANHKSKKFIDLRLFFKSGEDLKQFVTTQIIYFFRINSISSDDEYDVSIFYYSQSFDRLTIVNIIKACDARVIYTNRDGLLNLNAYENQLRILLMKTFNRNDPYPRSRSDQLIFQILTIRQAIANISNRNMEGNRYQADGPMISVLSERGIATITDKKMHHKQYEINTLSSELFFNKHYQINLQNKQIKVNEDDLCRIAKRTSKSKDGFKVERKRLANTRRIGEASHIK